MIDLKGGRKCRTSHHSKPSQLEVAGVGKDGNVSKEGKNAVQSSTKVTNTRQVSEKRETLSKRGKVKLNLFDSK